MTFSVDDGYFLAPSSVSSAGLMMDAEGPWNSNRDRRTL